MTFSRCPSDAQFSISLAAGSPLKQSPALQDEDRHVEKRRLAMTCVQAIVDHNSLQGNHMQMDKLVELYDHDQRLMLVNPKYHREDDGNIVRFLPERHHEPKPVSTGAVP